MLKHIFEKGIPSIQNSLEEDEINCTTARSWNYFSHCKHYLTFTSCVPFSCEPIKCTLLNIILEIHEIFHWENERSMYGNISNRV